MKSPLRYPGGKSRASKILFAFFPKGIKEVVSPFFGGGSLELMLAESGVQIFGYDLFVPLVEFWNAVKNDRENLIQKCMNLQSKMDRDYFRGLQVDLRYYNIDNKTDRAAAYFALNRSSFSGTVLSGGSSPGFPRFNIASINRIRDIDMTNINIEAKHFKDSIIDNEDKFLYCDPTYLLENSNLYGEAGSLHKTFKHDKLKNLLTSRKRWILSYNDCAEIRDMYKGYEFLTPEWKYGMSTEKQSNEVLIINY